MLRSVRATSDSMMHLFEVDMLGRSQVEIRLGPQRDEVIIVWA